MIYDELIALGAHSLAENEHWAIIHPDGPLVETASRDFTVPVRLICDALDADWDDLTEQGYRIGKITVEGGMSPAGRQR